MNYRIVHTTRYVYSADVMQCHNETHLSPRSFGRQHCQNTVVQVDPPPADVSERDDFFGNRTYYFSIQRPHRELKVTAISQVQVDSEDVELNFYQDPPWDAVCRQLAENAGERTVVARQYMLDSPLVAVSPDLGHYAEPSFPPGRPLVEAVRDLMGRIYEDFTYDPEFSNVATRLSEVLAHRRGVCQDFAQLAIGCLRSRALAARYVSGYIETQAPSGQTRLVGADASHAWFGVYVPDYGWVDFDPTNNQIPMDQHITTAWGRDYGDVTPLKGVIFGGGDDHQIDVSVDVQRI